MCERTAVARQQRFGDRIYDIDEVLRALGERLNIPVECQERECRIFTVAYAKHHGASSVETECGRKRIAADIRDLNRLGELPYYVMRLHAEYEGVL